MICNQCARELEIGEWPFCPHGQVIKHDALVHCRERAVIYRGPRGERITPARADEPMPARYIRRGFQREEILEMGKYERASGVVHEPSNFHPGNEPSPDKEPEIKGAPPDLRERLIDDLRQAAASGPWTTSENQPLKSFAVDAPIG